MPHWVAQGIVPDTLPSATKDGKRDETFADTLLSPLTQAVILRNYNH